VGLLFLRQRDVAADGTPSRLASAAVGGLHDTRTTPGHYREAGAGQLGPHLAGQPIVGMLVRKPRRAEHRDAGPDEVKGAKAADHLPENPEGPEELEPAWLRALKEPGRVLVGELGAGFPVRAGRDGWRGVRFRVVRGHAVVGVIEHETVLCDGP